MSNASMFRRVNRAEEMMLAAVMPRTPAGTMPASTLLRPPVQPLRVSIGDRMKEGRS